MANAPTLARLKVRFWLKVRLLPKPGDALRDFSGRCHMSTAALLTHDEHKASEAAFHGLPLDPKWSSHAQEIYLGILAVTNGRDIVRDTEPSALAIAA